jgi:DNA-binding PadR family transcriptional regulator
MASTPLHEPTFLILTALAEQPRYGYDVIQEVAALSGGRVTLRAGTLYGAFDRLTDQGWIGVDREEVVDGRLRRYYRLTDSGAEVLEAESHRLRANAEAAHRGLRARAKAAGVVSPPSFARLITPPPVTA